MDNLPPDNRKSQAPTNYTPGEFAKKLKRSESFAQITGISVGVLVFGLIFFMVYATFKKGIENTIRFDDVINVEVNFPNKEVIQYNNATFRGSSASNYTIIYNNNIIKVPVQYTVITKNVSK